MKRMISLLLTLLMLCALCVPAGADNGDYSILYEDVSEIEVVEGKTSEYKGPGPQGQVGTDVYLFVDPDSASEVVFIVRDDDGNLLPNAQIYILINGMREYYGCTDEQGRLSTYLFRNVEYGYEVIKPGYESASGTFTPVEELEVINVVLRIPHKLVIKVLLDEKIVPDAIVKVNGKGYVTDETGCVTLYPVYKGDYTISAKLPDGRTQTRQFALTGDSYLEIAFATPKKEVVSGGGGGGGGGTSAKPENTAHFIVYDKVYIPEDYVLTKYVHSNNDLPRLGGESEEEYALRLARFREQYPDMMLIEAQPDRIPQEDGTDVDVLRHNGEKDYTQRELIVPGSWLDDAAQSVDKLVFTNEYSGLALDLADLSSGDIMYAFGLLWAMGEKNGDLTAIAKDPASASPLKVAKGTSGVMKLGDETLSLMRTFSFDAADRKSVLLDRSMYESAIFEYRLTPVTDEALDYAVTDNLLPDSTEILLANTETLDTMLRTLKDSGQLTDEEGDAVYSLAVDARLDDAEIAYLRQLLSEGKLTEEEIHTILEAVMDRRMYRVAVWLRYNGSVVDVTNLIESLRIFRKADDLFAAAFSLTAPDQPEAERILAAKQSFEGAQFLRMSEQAAWDELPAKLLQFIPQEGEEFRQAVTGKSYERLVVDVRPDTAAKSGYKAIVDKTKAAALQAWTLAAPSRMTCLYTLKK